MHSKLAKLSEGENSGLTLDELGSKWTVRLMDDIK